MQNTGRASRRNGATVNIRVLTDIVDASTSMRICQFPHCISNASCVAPGVTSTKNAHFRTISCRMTRQGNPRSALTVVRLRRQPQHRAYRPSSVRLAALSVFSWIPILVATNRQLRPGRFAESACNRTIQSNRSLTRWIPCELTPRRQCRRIVAGSEYRRRARCWTVSGGGTEVRAQVSK